MSVAPDTIVAASETATDGILPSPDESSKEDVERGPGRSPRGSGWHALVTAPTPNRSALGRIAELFSPVKTGYPVELARIQASYQECDQERRRLADELHSQRASFEAERKAMVDSHRNEIRQLGQQLHAAQQCVSDLNSQLESERTASQRLVRYLDETERFIAWCKDELEVKTCLQNTLQSAFRTIDATVNEADNRIRLHGFSQARLQEESVEDRMALLVAEAASTIGDLKHDVFELEACLEHEHDQAAEYQQCIHSMEDDILELQVQRDQAVEELKKCSSIPDLELARAEAELIATECMVELAVAGESLEQATNTVVCLNEQLSDVHSDVKIVTTYAQNLERRLAELLQESALWRVQYYALSKGVYDRWSAEAFAERYESVIRNTSKLPEIFKRRLEDEMGKNTELRTLLANSEVSLEISDQIQFRLRGEIQQARDKISLFSRYASTLQSLMGGLLEDASDLIDYRFTSCFASDYGGRDRYQIGDGIADS